MLNGGKIFVEKLIKLILQVFPIDVEDLVEHVLS